MIRKKIFLLLPIFFLLTAGVLRAEEEGGRYRLKEITPEVQQAFDGRKSRFHEIRELKEQGLIGEDNQGFIQMLKPSTEAAKLIDPENSDRTTIYNAIVRQNKLGPAASAQVQTAFAEVRREKGKAGEYFQDNSGKWVQKP